MLAVALDAAPVNGRNFRLEGAVGVRAQLMNVCVWFFEFYRRAFPAQDLTLYLRH